MKTQGYVKLLSSAADGKESKLELSILPGEKTSWHYHTLFSETFEVLQGTLEVGKANNIYHLTTGDIATIEPNEKHYYHNISKQECIITVTPNPGNENFEKSLFILKGLARDGLASKAGTPGRFSDLAVFIYLSNSRMIGFQKIAEPVFNFFAQRAIKKEHLNNLVKRYQISDNQLRKA